jgi:hypothetical protein
MKNRTLIAALLGIALLAVIAVGVWYELMGRAPAECQICGRPIHAAMKTVAEEDGRKLYACCPTCAITGADQTGRRVKLLRVTDFDTHKALDPAKAYYVEGSQVNMCSAPHMMPGEERVPYERTFDRCSPSMIAFASEDKARAFMAKNGGVLKRLGDLRGEEAIGPAAAGGHAHD